MKSLTQHIIESTLKAIIAAIIVILCIIFEQVDWDKFSKINQCELINKTQRVKTYRCADDNIYTR